MEVERNIPDLLAQEAITTAHMNEPHNSQRLTRDVSAQMNRRIKALHDQGLRDPVEFRNVLNAEFGVEWSWEYYCDRLRRASLDWTCGTTKLPQDTSASVNLRLRELSEKGLLGIEIREILNREFGVNLTSGSYRGRMSTLGLTWRSARGTGNESIQINDCLKELWALGRTAEKIREELNRKFARNFSRSAYQRRAYDLGLRLKRTHPAPPAHRGPVPPGVVPTDVSGEQREACLQDPAWEARNRIADWTACRECFRFYKGGGLYSHIEREHGGLAGYRRLHPGARVFSFEHVAKEVDRDCQDMMRECAESYATPEERAEATIDPDYYDKKNITAYRICCIDRCGLKAADLPHHLLNVHGKSTLQYWMMLGRAVPVTSEAVLAKERQKAAAKRAKVAKVERIFANIGRDAEDEVWARVDELYRADKKWKAIKAQADEEFGFKRSIKAYQEGRKRYLARLRQKPTK